MPISLAKKKDAPTPSNSGGGGTDGKPGAPLGLLAAFLAAGAFVAQLYAPPNYSVLAFQVLGGLAGIFGAFGALGAVKGLRSGPKGPAVLGLLLSVGALGAVAYGFSRPSPAPTPEPPPAAAPGESDPAVTATNAPTSTNAVAVAEAPKPATTNDVPEPKFASPVRVERLLPATTRTTLMRARTGPLSKPEPKPVIKVTQTEPKPEPPKPTTPPKPSVDPAFPELATLAPAIDLPPPPSSTPQPRSQPNTFRGATLATFEEINLAARGFEAVNNLDIAQLLDVSDMNNAQVIANRYQQIALWLQRQTAFKSTIERADAVYEQRLRRATTAEDRLMTTLAKFRETRQKLYTDTLAQTTAVGRVNAAAAGVLKVLGNHFDAWKFDAKSKKLLFDDQETAAQYQAAIEKVKQASAQVSGH